MRIKQSAAIEPSLAIQASHLGEMLVRLRHVYRVKQSEAAIRAGLSRNTALRMEKGDPSMTIGSVLRYINAIAPGLTLLKLLAGDDPFLAILDKRLKNRRVRDLTAEELKELDF
jgi:transcriptional regulator with XRE-family HTH domain